MSTKKRFYIKRGPGKHRSLWDEHQPYHGTGTYGYPILGYIDDPRAPLDGYIGELCVLLNKGHEAMADD